jgi:thermostable 8-oxoguanine DNA glycosylase
MINPKDIIKYNRSKDELEELAIFCIAVAGKPADRMAEAVDKMLNDLREIAVEWYWIDGHTPFELIAGYLNTLDHRDSEKLKNLAELFNSYKITPNVMKAKAVYELIGRNFDLNFVTAEELESIHGIAEKTSRFFCMCTQFNVQYAALDTHILKWLHNENVDFDLEHTLKNRPRGRKYERLEREFLNRVPEHLTPAEFDLEIWTKYSTKSMELV